MAEMLEIELCVFSRGLAAVFSKINPLCQVLGARQIYKTKCWSRRKLAHDCATSKKHFSLVNRLLIDKGEQGKKRNC